MNEMCAAEKKEHWAKYYKTALTCGGIVGLVLGCYVGVKVISIFRREQ